MLDKRDKERFKLFYVLSISLQLGFLIAIPIIVFLLVGIFLDEKLNTFPLFLIGSVIFSLVFVVFEIRYYFSPFLERKK
ncbi:AtpZ/AtpI family protein [bacterium]|nr:AtpZ/AtpI family protein [bacterium]